MIKYPLFIGDMMQADLLSHFKTLEDPRVDRTKRIHWTLDVTFREDESRIRKEAAPENYAVFRHIALNIIRRNTSIDASVKRKRHMAALNDDVRTTLIMGLI
jgi:hypothetical protein